MNDRISRHIPVCGSSPTGCGIRPKFAKKIEDGRARLVKVGETDQQALINSYKDECDFNRIVERYQNGDISALARVQGLYTDLSGYPDNSTDLMNMPIRAQEILENLSKNETVVDGSQSPVNATEKEEVNNDGNAE